MFTNAVFHVVLTKPLHGRVHRLRMPVQVGRCNRNGPFGPCDQSSVSVFWALPFLSYSLQAGRGAYRVLLLTAAGDGLLHECSIAAHRYDGVAG